MSHYPERKARGRQPWLTRPMANRNQIIAGVMIHSTRSGRPGDVDDLLATENWGMNPNNARDGRSWGSYWDIIIGRETGERVISTDWDNERPTHTAGFGGPGTWLADMYYLQAEVCQARIDQPFSTASIDSLAEWTAIQAKKYGFPLRRIDFLDQTGTPPRGICTHQYSANGRRLGKSDPGPLFPWDDFFERANHYLHGKDDDMNDEEIAEQIREQAERLAVLNDVIVITRDLNRLANMPHPHNWKLHKALREHGYKHELEYTGDYRGYA